MMTSRILGAAALLAILGATACRPLMFWRDPLIHGQTKLMGEALPSTVATDVPVTLNFIHQEGTLEGTLVSVEADPVGRYRSPKLVPGTYTVEAMLPGYVIGRAVVVVRSHEYKRADFNLYRIGEAEGKTLSEATDDNIPAPGEVQIGRPKF
jgi:hypothetical protein